MHQNDQSIHVLCCTNIKNIFSEPLKKFIFLCMKNFTYINNFVFCVVHPVSQSLPQSVFLDEFSNNYDLSPNSIKNKLYREENPNTYLAGFARFLIENKSNEYFKEIIFKGLERFIDYQILQYDDFSKVDIHYVDLLLII